jgi:hypothetical protein
MLEALAAAVHDADHKVVAMQVNSCKQWVCHLGFLSVVSLFVSRTDNNVLPEGNLPSPLRP